MRKKLQETVSKRGTELENYSLLSEIYADLMSEVNYRKWAKYIYCIAKEKINPGSDILELASGTGRLASNLQHKNKNILCTDLSRHMLKQGSCANRVACDMTRLPFKKEFDLVFSTFDSVNYLLSKQKILRLFTEVRRCLKKDGMFAFDVSLEKNSYIHQRDSKKSGHTERYSYTRESLYNQYSRIHRNIFFIRDKDGNVFTEVHKQKIYDFDVYFDLLDRAGLYVENCYRAFSLKNGSRNSDRVQFIARRK